MEPATAIAEAVEPEAEEREARGPRVYHPDVDLAVCGPWQEGRPSSRRGTQRFNSWRRCSLPDGPDFIQMQLGVRDGSHTALFDPEDLERVQMHIWRVVRASADRFYVQTNVGTSVGRTVLQLHRHLWPEFPAGRHVDHRNRNGKDNRRANLVDGGDGKNQNNTGVRSDNKGYLTGVARDYTQRRWKASIGTRGKDGFHCKYFPDAKYDGDCDRSYAAACAQRTLWAEAAGNRNGLSPR